MYPQRNTPEIRRFHSIHTPTGRVWNGKGLSHGLKTCHWHVSFLQITAPEMDDRILAELLNTESDMLLSIHIRSMDQNEAIKTVKLLCLSVLNAF